jgi:hypothetical protein
LPWTVSTLDFTEPKHAGPGQIKGFAAHNRRVELTDDELVARWERQELGGTGVSHLEHVRIAWTLVATSGAVEAERRLVGGTRRACEHYGCPEKFDEALTRRWSRAVADAFEDDEAFDAFLVRRPELRNGRLFGIPDAAG